MATYIEINRLRNQPLCISPIAAFLALALSAVALNAQCTSQCPPCKNNYTPFPGRGTSGNVVNVYIDSSWNVGGSPDPHIVNPTNDAIAAWNSATDSNNCNGHSGIKYVLTANQNSTVADITIKQVTRNQLFCSETDSSARPVIINMPGALVTGANAKTEPQLATMLEHEIGHALGLADAYKGWPAPQPDCTSTTSIMQGVNNLFNCNPIASAVLSSGDVTQANRNTYNESSC
jgi:hypothetical protein